MAAEYAQDAPGRYCVACEEYYRQTGIYPVVEGEVITTLEGTEKQVTWATDLRAKLVGQVNDRLKRIATNPKQVTSVEELANGRRAFVTIINQQPSAKWWIDHRDEGLRALNDAYTHELSKA